MRVTRDGVNRIIHCKYINQALVFLNRSHATLLTKGIFITASTRRRTIREMCEICIVTTFFVCVWATGQFSLYLEDNMIRFFRFWADPILKLAGQKELLDSILQNSDIDL